MSHFIHMNLGFNKFLSKIDYSFTSQNSILAVIFSLKINLIFTKFKIKLYSSTCATRVILLSLFINKFEVSYYIHITESK